MADPINTYCTIAQLELFGLRAEALTKFQGSQKTFAIESASRVVDGYLAQYQLPLVAIGADLSRVTAVIAAYDLLSSKGLNPDNSASDKNVIDRYQDALKWLKLVAEGTVVPSGIIDSGSGAKVGEPSSVPRVISSPSRGYSVRGTEFEFYKGPFQGS